MITVVGAGIVGTALLTYPHVRLLQSAEWDAFSSHERSAVLAKTELFVNAVAIAGSPKCEAVGYANVMAVNVAKALAYLKQVAAHDVPVVVLSTTGVYATTTSLTREPAQTIDSPVYPHNLYCASKLLMEQVCQDARILRIPWFFTGDYLQQRAKAWRVVQDTYTSYLESERLYVCLCQLADAPPGLYQCHSGIVYLPDMLPALPVRTEVPTGMSAAVPIQESSIFQ